MNYEVVILRRAQRELKKLSDVDLARIDVAILGLSENPRPAGCKKLVDRTGWRIRSGDYRIIYDVDDAQKKVTVFHVGHRRDVYS